MKKRLVLVLLVGALIAQPVFASDVGFTETGPVSSATPESMDDDIRVERPFHRNTTAYERATSNTKWIVQIDTRGSANRTYLINRNVVTTFDETEDVSLYVDGKETEYDTIQALNKTWIRFEASGSTLRVKMIPSQLAGGGGGLFSALSLEKLRLIFLDNPVTILIGIGVLLLIVFGVISSVMSQNGVVEWIE